MLLRLLERWNAGRADPGALERYYRDEQLHAELAALHAGAHDRRLSSLERSFYAASSYFAA